MSSSSGSSSSEDERSHDSRRGDDNKHFREYCGAAAASREAVRPPRESRHVTRSSWAHRWWRRAMQMSGLEFLFCFVLFSYATLRVFLEKFKEVSIIKVD